MMAGHGGTGFEAGVYAGVYPNSGISLRKESGPLDGHSKGADSPVMIPWLRRVGGVIS